MMKKVAFITNAGPATGVGQYASALEHSLSAHTANPSLKVTSFMINGEQNTLTRDATVLTQQAQWPGVLKNKTINWVRLGRRLKPYLQKEIFDVVHLTNQTLSFLVQKNKPHVVTVHDLIEILSPQSRAGALAAKYLYQGISNAAHLICVSSYTAQTVQEVYKVAAERITVIPNGVDSSFYPIPDFQTTVAYHTLLQDLKIEPSHKIILYVGSEHPRKNVAGAIQAFAEASKKDPALIFLKVGVPGLPAGRLALLNEIDRCKIRSKVRFMGQVTTNQLNELYNLASVFIYPSRFEGFGLPPLQAMAAGLPVITSNTTSLTEVVGNSALTFSPDDINSMAHAMGRLSVDTEYSNQFRDKGLHRAKLFSWESNAEKVYQVYKRLWH